MRPTGLSPEYDDIIEFSACHILDGTVVEKYETLINPKYDIPEFIEELTGITNDMLKGKPTIQEVLPNIHTFLSGRVLLGHNVHFDLNFLYDALKKHMNVELDNDYVDLLRVARKVYPEYKTHKLLFLSKELNVRHQPKHRALDDALATYEIYEKCKQATKEKGTDFTNLFKMTNQTIHDVKSSVNVDNEKILNGEVFVFTGTLEKMDRKKAWEIVVKNGGDIAEGISKKVDYLVLGNGDYHQRLEGGKSSKMKKAESLILKGCDLKIISENVFYDLMGTLLDN